MDAEQRVMAMRTIYEDVVTNVTYEAATRIMVAERKSQQLEHELSVTKDEAVQKMQRLKMLMDEKIREANNKSQKQQEKIEQLEAELQDAEDIIREANTKSQKQQDKIDQLEAQLHHEAEKIRETYNKSQKQQEKIDELESQLQEAEDIVGELRNELRYAQEKYERVIRSNVQHVDKRHNATSQLPFVQINRQQISYPLSRPLQPQKFFHIASDKGNSYLNQRAGYPQCPSQLIQLKNSSGKKLELPSIIRRSKKMNGFAQVIHAYQRNVLEGKEGEQTGKSTCDATINGADKMFYIGSKEVMHKDDSVSRGDDPNCKSIRNNSEPNHDPTPTAPKLSLNLASIAIQPEFTKTTELKEGNIDKGDTGTMINKGESAVNMSVLVDQEKGPSLLGDKRVAEGKNNTSRRKKAKQNDSESSLSIFLYGGR